LESKLGKISEKLGHPYSSKAPAPAGKMGVLNFRRQEHSYLSLQSLQSLVSLALPAVLGHVRATYCSSSE
jgi:hypothetical protein